jgi:hypothetical protein
VKGGRTAIGVRPRGTASATLPLPARPLRSQGGGWLSAADPTGPPPPDCCETTGRAGATCSVSPAARPSNLAPVPAAEAAPKASNTARPATEALILPAPTTLPTAAALAMPSRLLLSRALQGVPSKARGASGGIGRIPREKLLVLSK